MIEPSLAYQTAVRAALIASPDVSALVPVDHIRAGSTRPDKLPCIILGDGQTEFLGRASGSQFLARVSLTVHIWAIEDGADTAKAIGFAVCNALADAPATTGFAIDEHAMPSTIWIRDPQPERTHCHGVAQLEAVVRWSV
ncbi:DUF3168 domain-containing protein [Defluviimonas sp. D31]|uniref:DUF3168 domain-containing protein n=1 Tax=Defluviimonas sp. D31 TaxID=3083253 RepID=UPI00296F8069|nr:DUF3168 domain-containing protein [Defluviimonas sp. D31]MDW4548837.1 DUF3168 domain-containing protein [Defluviimonas sp. D31]